MPRWLSLGFQDSSSPFIAELKFLHDHIIVVMIIIIILVSYIIVLLVFSSYFYKYFSEGTFIETIWSLVPAFLLIVLVVPSIKVLYLIEDVKFPSYTYKVVAHQWYWSYTSSLWKGLSFGVGDSLFNYFSFDSILESSNPRLLSRSSDLILPLGLTSRLIVRSTDVIHAFSVPALGLKVDAFPGRVNQLFAFPSRLGFFFGQCSEICGSNHSFMPVRVKVVRFSDYSESSVNYVLDFLLGESETLDSFSIL